MAETEIGSYVLDTLQIYFPWDDDLYTYLKKIGLMSKDPKLKVLPLIYSDNCESTMGLEESERRHVLRPETFGETHESLGWKPGRASDRPVIPAEKPELSVSLGEGVGSEPLIKFKVMPSVGGKEQYHPEYSRVSSFGKMYSNWATFYLPTRSFWKMFHSVESEVDWEPREFNVFPVKRQSKQEFREALDYVELPVLRYRFSIAEFRFAKAYLVNSGVDKDLLPSLDWNSENPKHRTLMSPFIRLGILWTGVEDDFFERNPQIAMKIAQEKIIDTGGRRRKVKGYLNDKPDSIENSFVVGARAFLDRTYTIKTVFEEGPWKKEKP